MAQGQEQPAEAQEGGLPGEGSQGAAGEKREDEIPNWRGRQEANPASFRNKCLGGQRYLSAAP